MIEERLVRKVIYLLCIPFFILPVLSHGQENGRMTEAEMSLQGQLLEAQRQRILGNYKAAEAQLLELVSTLDTEATLFYELALVQNELEKMDEAIKAINRAIEISPSNEWFLQTKANLAEDMKDFETASDTYGKLIDLFPGRTNYYLSKALMELKNEQPEEALSTLNRVEEKVGILPEVSQKKHLIYDITDNEEKAVEELKNLIDRFPYNLEYRHDLAVYYEKIGKEDLKMSTYRQILEIDPLDSKAQLAVIRSKSDPSALGQLLGPAASMLDSRTISLDEKIKSLIPKVQEFSTGLDPELGNALLDAAEELKTVHNPNDARILALEADVFYHMRQVSKSIDLYIKALESDDTNYMIWEQLMFALQEEERLVELLTYAQDASDLFPNEASALYLQAYALNAEGKEKRALSMLDQATIIAGGQGWLSMKIEELRGDIYFELEDYDQALIYYKESVKKGNKSPLIQQKIEQIRQQN